MDLKRRLQQDLQEAMRTQDQQRIQAIRSLMAALERAQEEKGKEAFDASQSEGEEIPPDREQTLSDQTTQDVIRNEIERRREAAQVFDDGGQTQRAEMEKAEIAILDEYLKTV
ncbi:MAG TPA: GatB/YqeY domain-containing protein [Anaerolineales bacterium]|nr:GatB/YqeY domain-containing protein [Anaerolineales bacterium]